MYRFLVSISLTLSMFSNMVGGVQCAPSGIDSNLADCCKDGMCPHHLSEQETQTCPHTLSPDASLSLTILNALPATLEETTVASIELVQVGERTDVTVTAHDHSTRYLPFHASSRTVAARGSSNGRAVREGVNQLDQALTLVRQ